MHVLYAVGEQQRRHATERSKLYHFAPQRAMTKMPLITPTHCQRASDPLQPPFFQIASPFPFSFQLCRSWKFEYHLRRRAFAECSLVKSALEMKKFPLPQERERARAISSHRVETFGVISITPRDGFRRLNLAVLLDLISNASSLSFYVCA